MKLFKASGIWENKDKNGNTFFSGTMGAVRIVMLKNTFKKEGSNEPDWQLYFEENKRKEDTKE
jgi:hypothetical protein